ncbi:MULTISPECIES: hypothetical protein [unclassified Bradyrhizobium]|uniref:hypothetical protein n=1 Tax=unclassified Bradyrhizobium TaxID=2631580 RepID=UPI003396F59F
MIEKALAQILENGLAGVIIVLLILTVIRLFALLMKARDEKERYLVEDRKLMLETIQDGADAADRLTRFVREADRMKV